MKTLKEQIEKRMETFKLSLDTSFTTLSEANGRSEFLKVFCEHKKDSDRTGMHAWIKENMDIQAEVEKGDENYKEFMEKVSYIFNPLNVAVKNDKAFTLAESYFDNVNFIKFESIFKKALTEEESSSDDGDGKIESEAELKAYAMKLAKKAFGDETDAKKIADMVSNAIKDSDGDFKKATGIITGSFNS